MKHLLYQNRSRSIISRRSNGSVRCISIPGELSKTDESFKDECDVNNIMDKFRKTGNLTHVAKIQGTYGDFSEVPDLQDAMQTVTEATLAFDSLPSRIRLRFGNSPNEFLNFMANPQNDEEAIKLGLKIRPKNSGPIEKSAADKAPGRVSPKPSTKTQTVDDKKNTDEE